jgi:Rrf2 family protein
VRLQLTKRADYGVRAMLALARAPEERLTAPRIAATMHIPAHFLPQVMADLARAGLVHSTAGRSGGYRLAREPGEITLLEVIDAVEGDDRSYDCVLRDAPCGLDGRCELHGFFADARSALLGRLATTSLANVPPIFGVGELGVSEP